MLAAIEKGFDVIGFSGHGYIPDCTYCMSKEGTEQYVREINRLKAAYREKIKVLCGIEADIRTEFRREKFDYASRRAAITAPWSRSIPY